MQLATVLAAFAALAAVEARGIIVPKAKEQPLLRLYEITDITSGQGTSSFTGRGSPDRCYNLPDNIVGFKRADAAYGYECDIYTELNCRGSSLTVGTPIPQARIGAAPPKRPTYQSWKCVSLDDDPFPARP